MGSTACRGKKDYFTGDLWPGTVFVLGPSDLGARVHRGIPQELGDFLGIESPLEGATGNVGVRYPF